MIALDDLRRAAQAALPEDAWRYYEGTADGDVSDVDARAWDRWALVPRVMTGLRAVDTGVELAGRRLATPIVIAASAGHGGADPAGEIATAAAAAAAGALMVYSNSATVPVERFGAAAAGPWWAQIYIQRDRAVTDDYVARARAAGAGALVLTLDIPGDLADAPFRRQLLRGPVAERGNLAVDDRGRTIPNEPALTPDDLAELVERSGLPVWAKGIMAAEDALRALDAGAAGIIVSNHGRRGLVGVASTASVLPEIADAVQGRAPIMVDGGIRRGVDVVRALALGADVVGIGRPVLWALAAGGREALAAMLDRLRDDIAVSLAGLGVGTPAQAHRSMVRPAP